MKWDPTKRDTTEQNRLTVWLATMTTMTVTILNQNENIYQDLPVGRREHLWCRADESKYFLFKK